MTSKAHNLEECKTLYVIVTQLGKHNIKTDGTIAVKGRNG